MIELEKKVRLKLKPPFVIILKIIGGLCVFCFCLFLFYSYQIHGLLELGYSKEASKNILFGFKKAAVLAIGKNKTLNAAFESSDYQEKNFDSYSKITYQKQEHLIQNINRLLKKGYSNQNISMILSHGTDKEVMDFAKRDKIRYLEEFYSFPYAKLSYYDRYVQYSDQTGEDEENTVIFVNLDMDKEAYTDSTLVSHFSTTMLVNKYRYLDSSFLPEKLEKISDQYTNGEEQMAAKVAVDAFIKMYRAAKREGLGLVINSSYRSYQQQQEICDTYASLYGNSYVEKYVAKPGFSEHQTGLSFDIGSTSSDIFAQSKEYEWMMDNAYRYGFILRYPKKDEDITLFRNEPWHYRYVGEKIASYIHEHQITFEEYYVQFLD